MTIPTINNHMNDYTNPSGQEAWVLNTFSLGPVGICVFCPDFLNQTIKVWHSNLFLNWFPPHIFLLFFPILIDSILSLRM